MAVSEWFEVEIKLYGTSQWRKTTPLVAGIKEGTGFNSIDAAQDFVELMTNHSQDLLYEDADWRFVRYTREVVE